MIIRTLLTSISVLFTGSVFSFPCYFTLVKDNCWTNYDVTVVVTDANTSDILTRAVVPKGQQWIRSAFVCQPSQKLNYVATFAPTIWEGEENTKYTALSYWTLPASPDPGVSAWEIPACYSGDFSQVPLPPTAISSCKCNFKAVPPIPPV